MREVGKMDDRSDPRRRRQVLGFIFFLGLCLAVSALGGLITASSVSSWYPTLTKPAFNPPNWIFGPVWLLLYVLMAVAAWRVWRLPDTLARSQSLVLFFVQLLLNLAWSVLFFGLQRIDLALLEILVLLAAIIMTAVLFWRQDKLAGLLFAPYIAWVSFASVLNAAIWQLNG